MFSFGIVIIFTKLFYILVQCESVFSNVQNKKTFDFIIVGAGSAGSVVANRLSENPNWNILLLEAGGNENYITDIPFAAPFLYFSDYNWGFKCSKSQIDLKSPSRTCAIVKGKAVGGTSVVNYLIYSRGNREDFDEWDSLGNAGWSYKEVLPYFKKSENCSKCRNIEQDFHGYEGPINIEYGFETPLVDAFLKAGEELGYKIVDINGGSQLGFSKTPLTRRDGKRCSTGKAFIKPILNRSNFYIYKFTTVTKILIDPATKKAYGVEFIRQGQKHKALATKEVILSAGTIKSPQLLMLSGIGPKEHLEEIGIPVLQNLKVGYNLQDHVGIIYQSLYVNESITLPIHRLLKLEYLQQFEEGKGPFCVPAGCQALAFVKSKYAPKSGDYPDIELTLGVTTFNTPLMELFGDTLPLPLKTYRRAFAPLIDKNAFVIGAFLMRPKSRGRIYLRDNKPLQDPIIVPNYLEKEEDVAVLVEGLKIVSQIAQTETFKKYDAKLNTIPFPGCENFQFGSDQYWACVALNNGISEQHHVGTCKMGPNSDPDAVVDPKLRVYGIKRLRVIDASVMPNIISGHNNAVAIMIGEKGADMIKSYWENLK